MKKILFIIAFICLLFNGISAQNIAISEDINYFTKIANEDESNNDITFENINESQRIFYLKKLLEAVKSGKLNAFEDHQFTKPLTTEQINNIFVKKENATVPDPNNPSQEITVVVEDEVEEYEITAIAFKEAWYFNPQTFAFQKKVIAVAPMLEMMVDDIEKSEVVGHKLLFWIQLP